MSKKGGQFRVNWKVLPCITLSTIAYTRSAVRSFTGNIPPIPKGHGVIHPDAVQWFLHHGKKHLRPINFKKPRRSAISVCLLDNVCPCRCVEETAPLCLFDNLFPV